MQLKRLGWKIFFRNDVQEATYCTPLSHLNHLIERLLRLYPDLPPPVKFKTPPWYKDKFKKALARDSHKSCFEYLDFLQEYF